MARDFEEEVALNLNYMTKYLPKGWIQMVGNFQKFLEGVSVIKAGHLVADNKRYPWRQLCLSNRSCLHLKALTILGKKRQEILFSLKSSWIKEKQTNPRIEGLMPIAIHAGKHICLL